MMAFQGIDMPRLQTNFQSFPRNKHAWLDNSVNCLPLNEQFCSYNAIHHNLLMSGEMMRL